MILLQTMTTKEILNWGTNSLVIGLGSVFTILLLLILITTIIKFLAKPKAKKIETETADETVKEAKVVLPVEVENDDDEIIAVIAAAISSVSQREGKAYAIKSYKRVNSHSRLIF